MKTVTIHFVGGPADGAFVDVPVEPDGGPPTQWTFHQRNTVVETGIDIDHVYEREQDEDGGWIMRHVRSEPA